MRESASWGFKENESLIDLDEAFGLSCESAGGARGRAGAVVQEGDESSLVEQGQRQRQEQGQIQPQRQQPVTPRSAMSPSVPRTWFSPFRSLRWRRIAGGPTVVKDMPAQGPVADAVAAHRRRPGRGFTALAPKAVGQSPRCFSRVSIGMPQSHSGLPGGCKMSGLKKDERELLDSVEAGEWRTVPHREEEVSRYQEYASAT